MSVTPIPLDVLAHQLRQIQAQLGHLLDGPLWKVEGLLPCDYATIGARLDVAHHVVQLAAIRVEGALGAGRAGLAQWEIESAEKDERDISQLARSAKPQPVCANDGKDGAA